MSSAGGFCTGSTVMCEHQRINSTSFVFSAALPALLATAATETIDTFIRYPEMFTALQENTRAIRAVLGSIESLEIISHSISPIVHLAIKYSSAGTLSSALESSHAKTKGSNASSILPRDPPSFDVVKEEALLQDVVDEALLQGVLITRAKRLYGDSDEKQVGSIHTEFLFTNPLVASWSRMASNPTNYSPGR
jgi:serine palmitoyltransferase